MKELIQMKTTMPMELINAIFSTIPDDFIENFQHTNKNPNYSDFKDFLIETVESNLINAGRKELQTLKRNNSSATINTKRRYQEAVLKEFNPDHPFKPKYLRKELMFFSEMVANGLHTTHIPSNLDEYKEAKLSELNDWKSDPATLVTEFPYISYNTKQQIESAYRIDTIRFITNYIHEHYDGNPRLFTTTHPLALLSGPFFGAPQKFALNKVKSDGKIYEYTNDENYKFSLHIDKSRLGGEPDNVVILFDELDRKIYEFAQSEIDEEEFKNNHSITFDLNACSRFVYGNSYVKNVAAIAKRVKRFDAFYFKITLTENGITKYDATIQPFPGSTVIKKSTRKQLGTLYLSKQIFDQIDNNKVLVMYRKVLKQLQFPNSEKLKPQILQVLHIFRLDHFFRSDDCASEVGTITREDFYRQVRLDNYSVTKATKLINETIELCIDHNIFINSYSFDNDIWTLNYIRLTAAERNDYPSVNLNSLTDFIDTENTKTN